MKKVINIILTFLLIVLLLIATMFIITEITILNEKFIIKEIETTAYYEKVTDSVKDSFKNNMIQSGIEEEFVEEIINNDKIKSDINDLVFSIYNNTDYNVETDTIINKLNKKISEILDSKGVLVSEGDKESINRFLNNISDTYISEITLLDGSQNVLKNIVNKINEYIPMANLILAIIIFIILIIMFLINRNIKFLTVTFFAISMLLLFIFIFVNYFISIENVLIFTKGFSDLIKTIMNDYINMHLYGAIIYFILGLIGVKFCTK